MFKSTLIYFSVFVITGALSLIGLSVFTRLLTPAEYGFFTLCMSAAVAINALLVQWIRLYFSRFFVVLESGDLNKKVVSVVFYLYLLSALVAVCIFGFCWIFNFNLGLSSTQFLGIVFITAFMQGLYELVLIYFRVLSSHVSFAICSIGRAVLYFITGWIILRVGFKAKELLLALSASYLVAFLFAVFENYRRNRVWKEQSGPDFSFAPALRYSAPLIPAVFITYCNPLLTRYVVQHQLGAHALGVYSVSIDLPQQIVGAALLAVNMANYNKIISLHSTGDFTSLDAVFRKQVTYISCIACVGTLGFFFLWGVASSLLLGKAFAYEAGPLLGYGAVAAALLGIRQVWLDHAYYLTKKTVLLSIVVAVGMLSNYGMLMVVLPQEGLRGAIGSMIFGYLVSIFVGMICLKTFLQEKMALTHFLRCTAVLAAVLTVVLILR